MCYLFVLNYPFFYRCMFELKIGKSAIEEQEKDNTNGDKCTFVFLRKVLEGVAEIVKEAEVRIKKDGLGIQAMDPMQVSMADIFLKASAFESFRCDKEMSLGLPLLHLLKIFRSLPIDNISSVLLSADDNATEMNIICEEGKKKYSSKLKLLSLNFEEYAFPEQEHSASIALTSSEFQKVVRTLGAFGDTLHISADLKGFVFTQDSDVGNTEVFFSQEESGENNETKEFTVEVNEKVEISLPYKCLATFGKFVSLGSTISLNMTPKRPIYITSKTTLGYLNYYIAPRDE